MQDKTLTEDEFLAELADGMTIGIGGWGSRRKPMALVRAIARSSLKNLTIVTYGGPDLGLLCALGKVAKAVFGFVSLDSIPLEPQFRQARQNGLLECMELDEGMFQWGLYAAAIRLPFLPTRAGLGTDILRVNPELRTIRSPYAADGSPAGSDASGSASASPGEELVAMPALNLDVALIHMNRADARGNGQYLGADPYFDDLFCMAASKRFMSAEHVVGPDELASGGPLQSLLINRAMVDGVLELPLGAHFTECPPDYGRDERFQLEYASASKSPEEWDVFRKDWIDLDSHADYVARLESRDD